MKEWTFKWASPRAAPQPGNEDLWTHMDHVVLLESDGWAFPGVALCSGQDTYSKRKGWLMARTRAKDTLERKQAGKQLRKSELEPVEVEGSLDLKQAEGIAQAFHTLALQRAEQRREERRKVRAR